MLHEMVSHLQSVILKTKNQNINNISEVTVHPVIVDFRKNLTLKTESQIIARVDNKHLLHSVVALFDTALPDVTPDLIYSVVTDKWARTIILLQSEEDALKCIQKESSRKVPKSNANEINAAEDKLTCSEEHSIFSDVYSDMGNSSSDNEEDVDEEPDFSIDAEDFVAKVKDRRKGIYTCAQNNTPSNENLVGIEHRIVGCASYERCFDKPGHKVLHLTLISVRKKWRNLGIGKYIISLIKDASITTEYDVIIVNADYSAVDFFEKQRFTSDVLANSTFADIGDTWFHSKRMCFLPSYISRSNKNEIFPDLDLKEMELDIALWREKSLQCHQAQAIQIQKLRQEILQLRAIKSMQEDKIDTLQKENDCLRDEKFYCEQKLLQQRMEIIKIKTDILEFSDEAADLEQEAKKTNELQIIEKIKGQVMRDFINEGKQVQITNVFLSKLDENYFKKRIELLKDSDIVTELYYCGKGGSDEQFYGNILKHGFTTSHFEQGGYGKGLYFSDSILAATQTTNSSILVFTDVALGKVQTVTTPNLARTQVPDKKEYDSIVVPSLTMADSDFAKQPSVCKYVIFDVLQTKPIALIEYK